MRGLAAVVLLLAGCEPRVTRTFVQGTVKGVKLESPGAVRDLEAPAVLIGPVLGYSVDVLGEAVWSRAVLDSPDSRSERLPALFLTKDRATFFTGAELLTASDSELFFTERDKLQARGIFWATFDAETVRGEFVAESTADLMQPPGCSSAPGLMVLVALIWLRRPSTALAG